ncbi:DUF6011 domain-containing protein [Solwaraspora sp. WMMD792]|uniref:DUF6011 domain-containing protein n=1 Tax=Solwaraspora sp. WMMD792 TaxID=3016099 RepID=UPI0024175F67|nr:DUF6011 domain-containing protein [Solwaraspora sp. WMMD792]MDG4768754.1 DUF6011 domain-containing protein [Solwaraspora sp. WMMD792]MDG4768793.1 DUF6011 domain-containing protein [Solwaraspora sp. WMMD792]MDG4768833.1 DUF6011 domain-containing protein [Solwaraspora sp. WMMD792]MDG4768851.1 DUF6011 domain-containing protein [Solwaraspora sp. WMMD792]MDG4768884.1 DUF6011 domain-containing protein [Solwaraspora sp. WMMD792]
MTARPPARPDLPPVLCLDCATPLTDPKARARRVGSLCWRRRRAEARRQEQAAAASVLPDPVRVRGGRDAGHDGPTLVDPAGVIEEASR